MDKQDTKKYFKKQYPNCDIAIMTIRTNQRTKRLFDDIRHYYGYTQGEFMERLMEYAMDEALQAGYIPQRENA